MRLSDVRQTYYDHSGKASEIVRQLGFAGIALVWLFKTGADGRWLVPRDLLPAAVCIAIGLSLDLLHYFVGAVVWGVYGRYRERCGTSEDEEFLVHPKLNWPANVFYFGKITFILVAYIVFIIPFFICRFLSP